MLVDAIVLRRNIDNVSARLELYHPKAPQMVIGYLHIQHEGKSIKYITEWSDLPTGVPVKVNGSPYPVDKVGKIPLARGAVVTCEGSETIYFVVSAIVLK